MELCHQGLKIRTMKENSLRRTTTDNEEQRNLDNVKEEEKMFSIGSNLPPTKSLLWRMCEPSS